MSACCVCFAAKPKHSLIHSRTLTHTAATDVPRESSAREKVGINSFHHTHHSRAMQSPVRWSVQARRPAKLVRLDARTSTRGYRSARPAWLATSPRAAPSAAPGAPPASTRPCASPRPAISARSDNSTTERSKLRARNASQVRACMSGRWHLLFAYTMPMCLLRVQGNLLREATSSATCAIPGSSATRRDNLTAPCVRWGSSRARRRRLLVTYARGLGAGVDAVSIYTIGRGPHL